MRHLASIGIVIVSNPRRGACLDMDGVGVSIDDFHTVTSVEHPPFVSRYFEYKPTSLSLTRTIQSPREPATNSLRNLR